MLSAALFVYLGDPAHLGHLSLSLHTLAVCPYSEVYVHLVSVEINGRNWCLAYPVVVYAGTSLKKSSRSQKKTTKSVLQ